MDVFREIYEPNADAILFAAALLVFFGLARIAFPRRCHGGGGSGALVIGLTLLLSLSLIVWMRENEITIGRIGPIAAVLVLEAILRLSPTAREKLWR